MQQNWWRQDNDSAEIWSSIISPTCWNNLPFL